MTKMTWTNALPYLLLAGVMVFFLSTHSPYLELDVDPSYILLGPARPPLYPLFILLFRWAGSYQFTLIMWLQGIVTFTALLYARQWLRKNLQLPDYLIASIFAIVLMTISLHFQIWYIQSEGLAFPLFIVAFFLLIDCFSHYRIKKIIYLAVVVSLLVLTRLQFYYFYPLFALLCIWYAWQKLPIKKIMMSVAILFGSMLVTIVVDHSYHFIKHGSFSGGSYSGLMLLVQALYLADDEAVNYFNDPVEKQYIQTMLSQRNAQGLNQDAALVIAMKPSYLNYAYQSYARNYLAIQQIIDDTLGTSVENTINSDSIYKANAIATKLSYTIFRHEWKKNSVFLLWKFIQCMGGVTLFLFFLLILLTSIYKIVVNHIRDIDVSSALVITVTIITFLNAAIIAVCNPAIPVYFCYSQFMFYCLAGYIINKTVVDYLKQERIKQPISQYNKASYVKSIAD